MFAVYGALLANTLTIINNTDCDYYLSISGYGYYTIFAGQTVPLPGTNIQSAKISWTGDLSSFVSVGLGGTLPLMANSSANGVFPDCINAGNPSAMIPYYCSWSQANPAANAVLVIY